jgi:hypothetical protein
MSGCQKQIPSNLAKLFVEEHGGIVTISLESHELTLRVTRKGYAKAWIAFEQVCTQIVTRAMFRWISSCCVCDRPGRRLVSSTFRPDEWRNV